MGAPSNHLGVSMISRRRLLQMAAAAPLLSPAGLLAQPARRVGGARILVRDNRVWMQVQFGGRGPYPFVIDTGSWANMIRKSAARELRLREIGVQTTVGVGGAQEMTHYEAGNVMLGNIDIGTADFLAYEDELGNGIHPEATGLLAANVMTTADSDLDFEAGEWRIYPDGRGERAGFEPVPSQIRQSARQVGSPKIFVNASVGNASYRLLVDTGAPGSVYLFPEASRRSGLWNDRTPYSPHRLSGFGGEGPRTRLVRGGELAIGHIRFERPLITLHDPDARERSDADGILGIGLLELMNLSTDVRGGRLWTKRNSRPPRPERYGMSGLWTDERGDRLVVVTVSPQSPAAEAGLQAGDEIHGVSLREWIRRLGGRPGDVVEIDYHRDGQPRTTRLTLRPFL
jgi:hypothetical protein